MDHGDHQLDALQRVASPSGSNAAIEASYNRPLAPTPPNPLVIPFLPCEWEGCEAQLVTASALLEHMYSVHVKNASVQTGKTMKWVCGWKDCDQAGKHWHNNILSERTLLAHLRSAFERDRRWNCGQCDGCAEIRLAGLVDHHKSEHDALLPSHDRGAKSAARRNVKEGQTYSGPKSGAKPKPPTYSTATGVLFTGWREPIDMQKLQPTPYAIPPELRDRILREHTRNMDPDRPLDVDVDGSGDRQPGPQDLSGAVTNVPALVGSDNIDAGTSASANIGSSLDQAHLSMSTSSGRGDLAPYDDPRPPPPPRDADVDYRAKYLIEKAKHQYVLQRQDELRDELEQLRAEYEAEYVGKENALDEVLRAKFGSTAETLTRGP